MNEQNETAIKYHSNGKQIPASLLLYITFGNLLNGFDGIKFF